MTPEFKASLAADRTLDRTNLEPQVDGVYDTFLSEIQLTQKQLSSDSYGQYLEDITSSDKSDIQSISLGYASRNFDLLDSNDNDQLDPEEFDQRLASLDEHIDGGTSTETGLPAETEKSLVSSLKDSFIWMKNSSFDKTWWSLGTVEIDAITKADLSQLVESANYLRTINPTETLLPGQEGVPNIKNLPASVKDMLVLGGVSVKTVPGILKNSMNQHHLERYPTLRTAAGIYSGPSNEIITEGGKNKDHYQQHEIGHYIDDVLAPGRPYYSDSDGFKSALAKDLASLPGDKNWRTEIPTVHPYVMSALIGRQFSSYSRKELFADMYQSDDSDVATKLRKYFPNTATLVDSRLNKEGIERFPQRAIPTV